MKKFFRNEDGATAIEYGLICALIVIACIVAFGNLGSSSNGSLSNVANKAGNAL